MQRIPRHNSAHPRVGNLPWRLVLALWAALFQLALPLGQGISVQGGGADGLPRTLVICSAQDSLRTVALPGAGPGGEQPADGARDRHAPCVVCLSYGGQTHLALPRDTALPTPAVAAYRHAAPDSIRLALKPRGDSYDARAPPAA